MTQCTPGSRHKKQNPLVWVWQFYRDGFKSMTVGRWLWAMILIKVIILFCVFRLFFFPNILQERYDTDDERADAVRSSLLHRNK